MLETFGLAHLIRHFQGIVRSCLPYQRPNFFVVVADNIENQPDSNAPLSLRIAQKHRISMPLGKQNLCQLRQRSWR